MYDTLKLGNPPLTLKLANQKSGYFLYQLIRSQHTLMIKFSITGPIRGGRHFLRLALPTPCPDG
jgi:hypothetical protein